MQLRGGSIGILAAVLLTLAVLFVGRSGPPPPVPDPAGSFSFAALGDAPYYPWEELRYRFVVRSLDAHDLSFVLHVGDIFWRPCTDEHYRATLDGFNGLRHAVIYTPGDNEWVDCWEPGSGSFAPRDRLARIRQLFFHDPARSLGRNARPVVTQSSGALYPEFVENARWSHEGIVFATVDIVGSANGMEPFPGRTRAEDDEVKRRTEAAAAWVREAFAEASSSGASAVVVGFHGNPDFEMPAGDLEREAFEPFLTVLEEEVERFGRPVLAVHGDGHVYTVDHPLVRRTTGRRLERFTRLQVPGSPDVGWVRIVVTPVAAAPFAFEEHVVPRWKFW